MITISATTGSAGHQGHERGQDAGHRGANDRNEGADEDDDDLWYGQGKLNDQQGLEPMATVSTRATMAVPRT